MRHIPILIFSLILICNNNAMQKPNLAIIPRDLKILLLTTIANNYLKKETFDRLEKTTKDMRALLFSCKSYAQLMYDAQALKHLLFHLIPVALKANYICPRENEIHYASIDSALALGTIHCKSWLIQYLKDNEPALDAATHLLECYIDSPIKSSARKIILMKKLFAAGVSPNLQRRSKETPLMSAIKYAQPQVAAFLFEQDLDLSLCDLYGKTAEDTLHFWQEYAVRQKDTQQIKDLAEIETMLEQYKLKKIYFKL